VLRVGLFGILGAGNIGNDAQMESVLRYLKADHPDAALDAMCTGPERLKEAYGIEAIPMHWQWRWDRAAGAEPTARPRTARRKVRAAAVGITGMVVDAIRIGSWVRRHDAVIVPGAGVLEATLPIRPWGIPYSMFLLCASGRIFGTKVALVCVGANDINKRPTRWLSTAAARLAFYRSYRDTLSRDSMTRRGLDTRSDPVYADLAYGTPVEPFSVGDARTVGLGVLEYYGDNDDRKRASELHAAYLEKIKIFVRWLVDSGHRVRLLVGDSTAGSDDCVVREIIASVRLYRSDLDPDTVTAEPMSTFADLMTEMARVGTVVATRYHNVICALRLAKPTISIGYSAKHVALMSDMGLSEFCQDADALDVELLIKQFLELEERSGELASVVADRFEARARRLSEQFSELSGALFPVVGKSRAEKEPVSG